MGGGASRIDLFPYTPSQSFDLDQLAVNVTIAVAAALGKLVIYGSDEFGRPDALLAETSTLDYSTIGFKYASLNLSLLQGTSYWFGIRHSSTASLSAWQVYATPDINGGTLPSILGRKVLRRTMTFANPATPTWGFASSEITSVNATAIWMRRA